MEVCGRVVRMLGFTPGKEIIVLAGKARPTPPGGILAERIGSTYDEASLIPGVRAAYLDRLARAIRGPAAARGSLPEELSRADLAGRGHFGAFETDKDFFMVKEVIPRQPACEGS